MQRNLKWGILALTMCFSLQPQMTAFADTTQGNTIPLAVQEIGPGITVTPWERYGDHYVDGQGTPIEGTLLRGISVSRFQGDIDWGRVAEDDITFAFVRMVSYGYEGGYTLDPMFDQNMRNAKANGIQAAPYIYLQTRTVEEARQAAQFAVDISRNYELDYPIAVDVESQYLLDLTVQELTDIVNAFCQVVEQSGYTPIIYSDFNKFTTEMDTAQFPYDLWMARYGTEHAYPNRTIWQATDQGTVDGINGNVCIEFAFKDYGAAHGEWRQEGEVWFYYQKGTRMTGWLQDGDIWYYLQPELEGAMAAGETKIIDGVQYEFDENGAMISK